MSILTAPHPCYASLTVLAMILAASDCVAETHNQNSSKQITSVSVVAGGSPESRNKVEPGKLDTPFGVAFDSQNNMYIVELSGGRIHRVDTEGELSTIAGNGSKGYSGDSGPATHATFNGMHNVAATSDGVLYIADSWNHCIRKIDTKTGTITTIAGTGEAGFSGDGGAASLATFNFLMCVSLNPAQNKLYVADLKNRRVRMIDLITNIVTTIAGNGKRGIPENGANACLSPLIDPRAVAVDSRNNIYILERNGHALRRVNTDGKIETVAGTGKRGTSLGQALRAQFNSPKHLAIDKNDDVIIADDQNARILRYAPKQATVTNVFEKDVKQPGLGLLHPHGVCVHKDGSIFIVDTGHHRVLRLSVK